MARGSIFTVAEGLLMPTAHASGPWDPRALHGGAPAALITQVFERMQPGAELQIGRLSFQFLRPIPREPLSLKTSIVRPGRRVQELAAELWHGETIVCRASALRVAPVPRLLMAQPGVETELRSGAAGGHAGAMEGPQAGRAVRFALDDPTRESFAASAMEMRWLSDPWALGAGRVWMRLRMPLLEGGEPAGALTRLAAVADFGNGVSAELAFETHIYINADLTIHLWRPPRGEWIGLDARTILHDGGAGLAESVLHDLDGPVGRAFQTLVVQER